MNSELSPERVKHIDQAVVDLGAGYDVTIQGWLEIEVRSEIQSEVR